MGRAGYAGIERAPRYRISGLKKKEKKSKGYFVSR